MSSKDLGNIVNTYFLILNYRSSSYVSALIDNINSMDFVFSFSIVVVNSFSDVDELLEIERVCSGHKNVTLLRLESNPGYARGNNFGLKFIHERDSQAIVFLCNPDITFVNNKVLNTIFHKVSTEDNVLCSSKMKIGDVVRGYSTKVNSLTDDILSLYPFNYVGFLFKKFDSKDEIVSDDDLWVEVGMLNGSFFGAKVSVLQEVDYFDERTFLYCEERILSKRVEKIGAQIYMLRDGYYLHVEGATTKKSFNAFARFKILCQSRQIYYREYTNGLARFFGIFFHRAMYNVYGVIERLVR